LPIDEYPNEGRDEHNVLKVAVGQDKTNETASVDPREADSPTVSVQAAENAANDTPG
jgi:hypothetical protein